jgi:3-dehydroquinate dehydratase/shikimate dehydrogenase
MVQMEVKEAANKGAQLIELRLDFLRKAPDFHRLLEGKPCQMLASVRRPADGGKWTGSEDARRMLLRQAIVGGFDWVDLETDVADSIPRFGKIKRIISYHNFREVPADLEKIHAHMCSQDADVVKIAVRATQPADNLRLLDLVSKGPRPTIAICMGDLGFPSRILGAKYGAPFTYAAFNPERTVSPGMPSFAELKQIYNYESINAATRVFGVIGDPVAHSLSPLLHNTAMHKLGINGVYLPFRVPRGALADFLKAFERVPVEGYSVTIPHKEEAYELAARKDPAVAHVHAANTLVRGPGGFQAYNTDYYGVLDSIRAHAALFTSAPELIAATPAIAAGPAPERFGLLQSKVVLILGAGGIARAVAQALRHEGALVTISNRTGERAIGLAEEIGGRHVEWQARHSVLCDMVVNCSSVGMHPEVDDSPLHPSFLKPGLVVFDSVYTPETTLLVKEARSRGCHVITGVDLFVHQAGQQLRLFTSHPPPVELIRKVVKRALSPVVIRDEEAQEGS